MENEIYIVRFDALIKFVWIDDQERFVDANSWNAAIEKAALEVESKSHIAMPLIARIRKLKII